MELAPVLVIICIIPGRLGEEGRKERTGGKVGGISLSFILSFFQSIDINYQWFRWIVLNGSDDLNWETGNRRPTQSMNIKNDDDDDDDDGNDLCRIEIEEDCCQLGLWVIYYTRLNEDRPVDGDSRNRVHVPLTCPRIQIDTRYKGIMSDCDWIQRIDWLIILLFPLLFSFWFQISSIRENARPGNASAEQCGRSRRSWSRRRRRK